LEWKTKMKIKYYFRCSKCDGEVSRYVNRNHSVNVCHVCKMKRVNEQAKKNYLKREIKRVKLRLDKLNIDYEKSLSTPVKP
jgi:hypothetical protein